MYYYPKLYHQILQIILCEELASRKKLSKISQAKLTVLQSGAGYGKTSALTQLTSDKNLLFSWYQVAEEDDDILPFMRHLFYSIQRVCKNFGIDFKWLGQSIHVPKVR